MSLHDDQKQFGLLVMEVMQRGLNRNMMIREREIFCQCFDGFDYERIALYAEANVERVLASEGMVRSRRGVEVMTHSARYFRAVKEEFGSFSRCLWGSFKGKTLLYSGHRKGRISAKNSLSDKVNKDLKHRGSEYLGSIAVYSHLQACGITNDHREECFHYREIVE